MPKHPLLRRHRRGFTMVEALVAVSLMAIAGTALLLGVSTSIETTRMSTDQAIALGMAEQLMDEIAGQRYMEVGATAYGTLGRDAGEGSTSSRSTYDDIDDYNGLSNQPPLDKYGIAIGADDGRGGTRSPAFILPNSAVATWKQKVDVSYVAEADLSTPLGSGQTSDFRLVRVHIYAPDPVVGDRELATITRVFCYVPVQ